MCILTLTQGTRCTSVFPKFRLWTFPWHCFIRGNQEFELSICASNIILGLFLPGTLLLPAVSNFYINFLKGRTPEPLKSICLMPNLNMVQTHGYEFSRTILSPFRAQAHTEGLPRPLPELMRRESLIHPSVGAEASYQLSR